MIPEKLKKLIELLTVKTQEKKAIWNKSSGANQFKLSLSEGMAIAVNFWPEEYNEGESYGVTIFNINGDAIEGFVTDADTEHETYNLLKQFHKAVSDQYYKVDETMDALLASIKSNEIIGIIDKPQQQQGEEDDLPF